MSRNVIRILYGLLVLSVVLCIIDAIGSCGMDAS